MTIATEIYTTSHRIRGDTEPGTHGLFSLLNRPTESYLEVERSEMNSLHELTKEPDRAVRLWLVKEEIVAVLVRSRAELGPSAQTLAGYTKPFPHAIRVVLGGFELRGIVHAGGRLEPGALLFESESVFLPLLNGRLRSILFPSANVEAPAMAFNRRMVHSLSLLPKDEMPLDLPDEV